MSKPNRRINPRKSLCSNYRSPEKDRGLVMLRN